MARKGLNIYKRKDGRWEGRYIKGRRQNRKYIYGSVYGQKFAEVKAKLIPLKLQFSNHEKITKSNFQGTLHDWLDYWLSEIIRPVAKPATCASYQNKIHNHILPELGNMQLCKLTQDNVQLFVNGLADKGLAPNSVRAVCRVLNAALSKAEAANAIPINPCKTTALPQIRATKIEALTMQQQKALEQAALCNTNVAAVILALYAGIRIGEICSLRWEDINFVEGLIHIRRTMARIAVDGKPGAKTQIIFGAPKTPASYRTIPFPTHLMAYLTKIRDASGSEYVVSSKGGFAEPRVVRYRFHRLLKDAGLPPLRFHSLRHTFATRCIEQNIDVTTLSRLLGHSSPKLTLDVYTDSMPEQKKIAMSMMDKLFVRDGADRTGNVGNMDNMGNMNNMDNMDSIDNMDNMDNTIPVQVKEDVFRILAPFLAQKTPTVI